MNDDFGMFPDEMDGATEYIDVNAVFNNGVSSDVTNPVSGINGMEEEQGDSYSDASNEAFSGAGDSYGETAEAAYSGATSTAYSGATTAAYSSGASRAASGRGKVNANSSSSVVRKVLPHDTNAEKAVVGSMMMDREAITDIADMLLPEDFYNAAYGVIFETICELFQSKKMVDIVTLMDALKKKNIPEEINNVSFLGEIINSVPTAVNAKQYAEIVRDKAILRRLIKLTDDISVDCYQQQDTVENILERAERDVFRLAQTRNGYNDFAGMSSIVLEVIDGVDKAARNKGKINGLSTGFIDLDDKLTGLHGGELIIVAARP